MTLSPETRKVIYSISGALLSLLVVLNVIGADDIARWQDAIVLLAETAVPFIGAVVNFFAVAKTKPGSDDPATADDVQRAKDTARAEVEREIAMQEAVTAEQVDQAPEVIPVPEVPLAYQPGGDLPGFDREAAGKHRADEMSAVQLPTYQKPGA